MLAVWLSFVFFNIVSAQLPMPTEQQLAYHEGFCATLCVNQHVMSHSGEIVALIHFNMATFFQNGDPGQTVVLALLASPRTGCNPGNWAESSKPSSFNPVLS